MKVFLREKKLSNNRRSLYLDFYPPIPHPETKKPTRREHLKLYIYERPKTEIEKDHNKETKILGETIRSQRQLDVQSGYYGFLTARNSRKSLTAFFDAFVDAKRVDTSHSNYENYLSIGKHLKSFAGESCTFADVDEHFCQKFRDYLLAHPRLSKNTAASYFDKFKYVIKEACKQKMLKENPTVNIKSIKPEEPKREFLTLDELQKLSETPFHYEELRRACLFAALTGLRYSDVEKLIWSEVQSDGGADFFLRFRQQKTKGNETLPLSEQAVALLGARGEETAKIFRDLNYSQTKYISDWTKKAGIARRITFHAFRHTFATLQITFGTDIYTVSKLLGHKNLQTTQIYARVIDEKKREAVNRIKLK